MNTTNESTEVSSEILTPREHQETEYNILDIWALTKSTMMFMEHIGSVDIQLAQYIHHQTSKDCLSA